MVWVLLLLTSLRRLTDSFLVDVLQLQSITRPKPSTWCMACFCTYIHSARPFIGNNRTFAFYKDKKQWEWCEISMKITVKTDQNKLKIEWGNWMGRGLWIVVILCPKGNKGKIPRRVFILFCIYASKYCNDQPQFEFGMLKHWCRHTTIHTTSTLLFGTPKPYLMSSIGVDGCALPVTHQAM